MLEGKKFELGLYSQQDIFDTNDPERVGLAVTAIDPDGEPFATLTVNIPSRLDPDVCECIGILNAAYIDTNNIPTAAEELIAMGIAEKTGFTAHCGYCIYPLLRFKKKWLESLDEQSQQVYKLYLASWEKSFGDDEIENEVQ